MVTKPIPIWRRWLQSPTGREKAFNWYVVAIMLLNIFIALGLIAFMLFWYNR